MAGKVDGHYSVFLREVRYLGILIGSVTTPAMHEDQSQLPNAVDFVMNRYAIRRQNRRGGETKPTRGTPDLGCRTGA
jgi:hypothetical protein